MMNATKQIERNNNDYGALSPWSISRLRENLSARPYAANQKNICHISDRKNASHFRYIQLNNPIQNSWIVVDIDCDNGSRDLYGHPEYYKYLEVPVPNIALKNPDNGHYQLIYAIDPVYTGNNARRKPQAFLNSIKKALIAAIPFADPSFVGHKVISWNPLSSHWEKVEFHQSIYSLNELKEDIDEKYFPQLSFDFNPTNEVNHAVEGERNISVFNSLRSKAYKKVKKAQERMSYENWVNELLIEGKKINQDICEPLLTESEVRGIVISVAKFTWFKYTGNSRLRVMEFPESMTAHERQKASAARTHEIIQEKTLSAILSAVESLFKSGEAPTYASIARLSGKHRTTIYRYKEEISSKIISLKKSEDEIKPSNDVVSGVHQVSVLFRAFSGLPLKNRSKSNIKGFLNSRKVSSNHEISFDGCLCSVPCVIGKIVSVNSSASSLEVWMTDQLSTINSRSCFKYSYRTNNEYLSMLNRTVMINRLLCRFGYIHPEVCDYCSRTLSYFILPEQSFNNFAINPSPIITPVSNLRLYFVVKTK